MASKPLDEETIFKAACKIESPEARIAWELVEELAATESHHKKMGSG